ncbi:MAG: ATP-binding cassette domain-containing protein, partial [Spirochaetes bacterium]|nr:ATP-binding cassette domain-containing protein [Spirochaetota bacterium]
MDCSGARPRATLPCRLSGGGTSRSTYARANERFQAIRHDTGTVGCEPDREADAGSVSFDGRPFTPEATDRWLERFGLLDYAEARVESLSKGMHHKVQFIAAVAHDPEIVILDEPFGGLDPVSVELLREAILKLREAGKTILFSTHVMDQAERLCNRVAIADRGGFIAELLSALAQRLDITRFEVLAPSLHRIFLDRVGGRLDEGGL